MKCNFLDEYKMEILSHGLTVITRFTLPRSQISYYPSPIAPTSTATMKFQALASIAVLLCTSAATAVPNQQWDDSCYKCEYKYDDCGKEYGGYVMILHNSFRRVFRRHNPHITPQIERAFNNPFFNSTPFLNPRLDIFPSSDIKLTFPTLTLDPTTPATSPLTTATPSPGAHRKKTGATSASTSMTTAGRSTAGA